MGGGGVEEEECEEEGVMCITCWRDAGQFEWGTFSKKTTRGVAVMGSMQLSVDPESIASLM